VTAQTPPPPPVPSGQPTPVAALDLDRKSRNVLIVAVLAIGALLLIGWVIVGLAAGSPSSSCRGFGGASIASSQAKVTGTDDLRALLHQRVGPFKLCRAQENPGLLKDGATAGLVATYADAAAVLVVHQVGAFSGHPDADGEREGVARLLESKGFSRVGDDSVSGPRGTVGTVTALENTKQGTTVVVWSDGNLFCSAFGAGDRPLTFYKAVPY
jgi:hypothetical protein